jgi:hypothetical protein
VALGLDEKEQRAVLATTGDLRRHRWLAALDKWASPLREKQLLFVVVQRRRTLLQSDNTSHATSDGSGPNADPEDAGQPVL